MSERVGWRRRATLFAIALASPVAASAALAIDPALVRAERAAGSTSIVR
jgi:hypothetical protein